MAMMISHARENLIAALDMLRSSQSALGPDDSGHRDWRVLGHFDGGDHSGLEQVCAGQS